MKRILFSRGKDDGKTKRKLKRAENEKREEGQEEEGGGWRNTSEGLMEGRRRWRSCVKGHVVALLVILINEDLDVERACSQQAAAGASSLLLMSSLTPRFSHAALYALFISFYCSFVLRCSLQLETSSQSIAGIS